MNLQKAQYDRDFLAKAAVRVFKQNEGKFTLVDEIEASVFVNLRVVDYGLIGNVAAWLLVRLSRSELLENNTNYFCEVCFLRTTETPNYRKSFFDPDNKWLVQATQCITPGQLQSHWGPLLK